MLKIRMQRTGRRNDPAFRIVVAEHTVGPKSGKFVEKVGSYYPKTKDMVLDAERIKYWISVGAQPSDRVHNTLVSEGIIEGKKRNVLPKKRPIVKEKDSEEAIATETQAGGEEGGEELVGDANGGGGAEDVEKGAEKADGGLQEEDTKSEVPEEAGETPEVESETTEDPAAEEKSEEKDKDAEEKADSKPAEDEKKEESK